MRSKPVRGTCAMFGNHCCSFYYYHLFITATVILINTVINSNGVEAVQLEEAVSSAQYDSGGAFLSEHPESIHNFAQQLRDFALNSRRHSKSKSLQANDVHNEDSSAVSGDTDDIAHRVRNRHRLTEPRFPSRITIPGKHQLSSRKRLQQSRQTQQIPNFPSALSALSAPSNYSRLTMRHDCDGGDCLKDNDAVSLYIPPKNNTQGRRPPPLLLLSNNPETNHKHKNDDNSNRGKKRHRQSEMALRNIPKPSSLHTGMNVLEPAVRQSQKPTPLPAIGASYYAASRASSYQGRRGAHEVKPLSELPAPPPFAGGAELTDFIQPGDTTTQSTPIYENNIPTQPYTTVRTGPAIAYYGRNRQQPVHQLYENHDYGASQPEALVPQSATFEAYKPILPSAIRSIYSTYSAQSPGPTPPPHYRPPSEILSVSFSFVYIFFFCAMFTIINQR